MNLRIEPNLKYCPNCKDEYRAEIVTCASCDIELLTGLQMREIVDRQQAKRADISMEISPDDELVDVRKGPILQIKELQAVLERKNIPSIAHSEDDGCGKGCCGTNLLLRVRMDDIKDVIAVLEQEHIRSTGLSGHDISQAGTVFNTAAEKAACPACGCIFSTRNSTCPDCGLCF